MVRCQSRLRGYRSKNGPNPCGQGIGRTKVDSLDRISISSGHCGTGGLGWTRLTQDGIETHVTPADPFGPGNSVRTSSTPAYLFGWVVGAGAEASLASFGMATLLARVEYLHYAFGSQGSSSSTAGSQDGSGTITTANTSGRLTVDAVRTGLTLYFFMPLSIPASPATAPFFTPTLAQSKTVNPKNSEMVCSTDGVNI